MDKVLVSACLLGTPCRYDGKSKADARVLALAERYELIPVCPEQLGGLPTPRDPSERQGARVVMASGRDVTENYRRGAEAALALCMQHGCKAAILKELLKVHGIKVYGESRLPAMQEDETANCG